MAGASCLVPGFWWLVVGGWWLVAGGWWLAGLLPGWLADGRWLVAGDWCQHTWCMTERDGNRRSAWLSTLCPCFFAARPKGHHDLQLSQMAALSSLHPGQQNFLLLGLMISTQLMQAIYLITHAFLPGPHAGAELRSMRIQLSQASPPHGTE